MDKEKILSQNKKSVRRDRNEKEKRKIRRGRSRTDVLI